MSSRGGEAEPQKQTSWLLSVHWVLETRVAPGFGPYLQYRPGLLVQYGLVMLL